MRVEGAVQIVLSFFVYSFLGWVCETIYCSVPKRGFVNRGFLSGPICPVYGFGALLVLFLLAPAARWPVVLFFMAMLVTSALEYLTSVILERLFHTKWWDYSGHRFHIKGRVCLLNSVLFGLLGAFLTLVLAPAVNRMLSRIPPLYAAAASAVLLGWLLVDLTGTVRGILSLGDKAEQLAKLREELREKTAAYRDTLERELEQRLSALPRAEHEALREELRRIIARLPRFEDAALRIKQGGEAAGRQAAQDLSGHPELRERIEGVASRLRDSMRGAKGVHRRLLRAFPSMRSTRAGREGIFEQMRSFLEDPKSRQGKRRQG